MKYRLLIAYLSIIQSFGKFESSSAVMLHYSLQTVKTIGHLQRMFWLNTGKFGTLECKFLFKNAVDVFKYIFSEWGYGITLTLSYYLSINAIRNVPPFLAMFGRMPLSQHSVHTHILLQEVRPQTRIWFYSWVLLQRYSVCHDTANNIAMTEKNQFLLNKCTYLVRELWCVYYQHLPLKAPHCNNICQLAAVPGPVS